ncbi:MAG: hypothetical protein KJN63_11600, partial [Acidimicrobiia bacterium]|nr:hypothetical protein [Acidimicrobiia bacterium]
STTMLRKLIRQGRLPEAEKVQSYEGRVWAVPISAISGIAERLGVAISVADAIDVREPDDAEQTSGRQEIPAPEVALEGSETIDQPPPGQAIEAAGSAVEVTDRADHEVSLAEVLDTALLERLLGAKDAETKALVNAERQRAVYESLAARQLEVEQRFTEEAERSAELARQLRDEAVARAVADARVTELRNQLQREITYSESERYERRQALAREASAVADAARTEAVLGWWSRRRLKAATAAEDSEAER